MVVHGPRTDPCARWFTLGGCGQMPGKKQTQEKRLMFHHDLLYAETTPPLAGWRGSGDVLNLLMARCTR